MRARDDDATPTEDVIRALEEELLSHETRTSRQRLGELLEDDFVEFGGSGRVFDKQRIVDALPSEQPGSFTTRSFAVRVLADGLALATYELESIRDGGAAQRSLRSSLWRQTSDGGWQVVFHQGTPVPGDNPH